jgi:hypothetical protein
MKFATLLAFSATAYGVAFDGPLPTPVADLVYAALTGYSPAPTNMARALPDLFRRQQKPSNDSGICGYLDGDSGMSAPYQNPPGRNTASNMFPRTPPLSRPVWDSGPGILRDS